MKTNSAILLSTVFAVAACSADNQNVTSNSAEEAASSPSLGALSPASDPAVAGATLPGERQASEPSPGKDPVDPIVDPNPGNGTGNGGGAVASCTIDSDCPASNDPCAPAACKAGVCSTSPVAEGTVLVEALQVRGDCRAKVCGSAGTLMLISDMDDASDGNECTVDQCSESGASHALVAAGTACSKGKCGDDGICRASGETIWKSQFAMQGQSIDVDCVAQDSAGATVVTGRYHMASFPYIKAFVVKVNSHGGIEWQSSFGDHVDGPVRPAIGADDMVVSQFSSNFDTAQGEASNLLALSASGTQLWSHATEAGSFVASTGVAVDASGTILAGYSFLNDSCADFGGGSVCADGVASYDAAGQYVDFAAGQAMTPACNTNALTDIGEVISAHASGMTLVIEKRLQ